MKMIGSRPGKDGRFGSEGSVYHGGPGTKPGTRLIGDRPLTPAERARRHYHSDPKKAYETKRRWECANPEKVRLAKRRRTLKQRYGLTPELFDEIFLTQGKRCAICRSDEPFTSKGWQVDHCHKTGRVRGILCTHCNRMLAGAVDNPRHLLQAVDYLNRIDDTKT